MGCLTKDIQPFFTSNLVSFLIFFQKLPEKAQLVEKNCYPPTLTPPKKKSLEKNPTLQIQVAGHTLTNVTKFFDFIVRELKIKDREIFLHMFLAQPAAEPNHDPSTVIVILTFDFTSSKNYTGKKTMKLGIIGSRWLGGWLISHTFSL